MSYREVPAWLTDAEPTVLLDDEELTAESVSDSGGTWTAEIDGVTAEVRLAWTDRVFTHASAAVGDDRLALELASVPVADDADPVAESDADSPDADPVFVPEDDRRDFEVRLVADGSSDADPGGTDPGGT